MIDTPSQEALFEALRVWPRHPPRDPPRVADGGRHAGLVDARRSEVARHRREKAASDEPPPTATEQR